MERRTYYRCKFVSWEMFVSVPRTEIREIARHTIEMSKGGQWVGAPCNDGVAECYLGNERRKDVRNGARLALLPCGNRQNTSKVPFWMAIF